MSLWAGSWFIHYKAGYRSPLFQVWAAGEAAEEQGRAASGPDEGGAGDVQAEPAHQEEKVWVWILLVAYNQRLTFQIDRGFHPRSHVEQRPYPRAGAEDEGRHQDGPHQGRPRELLRQMLPNLRERTAKWKGEWKVPVP